MDIVVGTQSVAMKGALVLLLTSLKGLRISLAFILAGKDDRQQDSVSFPKYKQSRPLGN